MSNKTKAASELMPEDIPGEVRSLEAGGSEQEAWRYGERIVEVRRRVAELAIGKGGAQWDQAGVWLARLCELEDKVMDAAAYTSDAYTRMMQYCGFASVIKVLPDHQAEQVVLTAVASVLMDSAREGTGFFDDFELDGEDLTEDVSSVLHDDAGTVDQGRRDVLAYAMPGWSAASYTLIGKHADKAAWGKLAEMDEEQADMAAHWIKERGPRMLKTLVSMAPQIREDEEELAVVAKAVASCHQLFWLDTDLVVDALAELGVQAVGSGHEDGRSS